MSASGAWLWLALGAWVTIACVLFVVVYGALLVLSEPRLPPDPIAHLDFEAEAEPLAVELDQIKAIETVPFWDD